MFSIIGPVAKLGVKNMYTQLKVELREKQGMQAKKLLQNGWIPGVLYSKHTGSRTLQVKRNKLESCFQKDHAILEIIIGQEKFLASIKEIQSHPVTQRILHIAFLVIKKGQKAEITLQVKLAGNAPGAKGGGIVNQLLNEVNIRCEPKDAPPSLELDISKLQIGDRINLSSLSLPAQVELVDNPEQTIVTCTQPKVEEPAQAAEGTEDSKAENKKTDEKQKSEKKLDKKSE